jgi:hypothetical protein
MGMRLIGVHLIGVYLMGKKLRAATPESVLEEEEEEVQVPATPEQEPPVSTAPQKAEDRGKRKRRVTEANPLPQ